MASSLGTTKVWKSWTARSSRSTRCQGGGVDWRGHRRTCRRWRFRAGGVVRLGLRSGRRCRVRDPAPRRSRRATTGSRLRRTRRRGRCRWWCCGRCGPADRCRQPQRRAARPRDMHVGGIDGLAHVEVHVPSQGFDRAAGSLAGGRSVSQAIGDDQAQLVFSPHHQAHIAGFFFRAGAAVTPARCGLAPHAGTSASRRSRCWARARRGRDGAVGSGPT